MNALQEVKAKLENLPDIGPGYKGEFAVLLRRALRACHYGPKLWDQQPAPPRSDEYTPSLREAIVSAGAAWGVLTEGRCTRNLWNKLASFAPSQQVSPVAAGDRLRFAFIEKCETQLGKHDDRANGRKYRSPKADKGKGVDEYIRHAGLIDNKGRLIPSAFCGAGLRWCLDLAAAELNVKLPWTISASVPIGVEESRAHGRLISPSKVRKGDLIYLVDGNGHPYHIEVCTSSVADGHVETIGFNTSNKSIGAGGWVMRRRRPVAGNMFARLTA